MWGPPNVTPVHLWSFKQFLLWSGLKRRKKSIIISEIRNHTTNFLYTKNQGASVCTKISWELLLGVQFEALNTTMAIFWQNSKVWIAKSILLQGVLRTEVRGDFNIHGTKYFEDAVFHQKSKNYDVVSLLFSPWNIDTAGYYWKHLRKACQHFMERTGFLAHQIYRRLTTS